MIVYGGMNRHALSDRQWHRLLPLIPKNNGRPADRGDRNFFDAIVYLSRVGCSWRDLPEMFGPWKSIYNRFARWTHKDIWKSIFLELSGKSEADISLMDATIVRAHQDSSGGHGGPKKRIRAVFAGFLKQAERRHRCRRKALFLVTCAWSDS